MPRPRRSLARIQAARRARRHGRGPRGPITGPQLPILENRLEAFEFTVASTANYVKDLWPDELAHVHVDVAAAPALDDAVDDGRLRRWRVDKARGRVTLFRVPIERFGHLHRNDALHRRMLVEGCVFGALAEYLDCDPWDLAPRGFRP